MDEIKFKSITELYQRLFPALSAKKNELKLNNKIVSELEMWNYLRKEKWSEANNLTLANMVDDIFNIDIDNLIYINTLGEKNGDN